MKNIKRIYDQNLKNTELRYVAQAHGGSEKNLNKLLFAFIYTDFN